mmetsp:Transcript_74305/g.131395  ORF Transcript_74305/g.131395 Transcript_74305/m.131395 type:complete len:280 (-) Transcript_74305:2212-3051(-)
MLATTVGEVEVVGLRWELCCKCVNLLDNRCDASFLAKVTDVRLRDRTTGVSLRAMIHGQQLWGGICVVHLCRGTDLCCDLPVREASTLRLREQQGISPKLVVVHGLHGALDHVQSVQLRQEPAINLGQVMDFIHTHTMLERFGDSPDSNWCRVRELLLQLKLETFTSSRKTSSVHLNVVADGVKSKACLVDHTESFLDGFFEGFSDGHDFANALHGRANTSIHRRELLEVPAWNLGDTVVQRWFEASCSASRDAVPELHKIVAKSELGCYVGQGVACGF